MTHKEAFQLQLTIRKNNPELFAAFCRRGLYGPIGEKPWQVDANLMESKETIRFKGMQDYYDYKKISIL